MPTYLFLLSSQMYIPNKKEKKEQEKFPSIPSSSILIHLEEKRRNSANVIKQSPEFRYSIHVSLQQVFPLISKNPRQTGHPAGAWNGPNFIKRPGGHSWKSETALSRLTNEPPTASSRPPPRGLLMIHTSRSFPCEAFERGRV